MAKKTGGSAFPQANHDAYGMGPGTIDDTGIFDTQGMTLRDWFAGQALAGLARDIDGDVTIHQRDSIVSSAFELADAMIAERHK